MPQLYTRPRSKSFGERPLTQPSEADCRVGGGGAVEPRQRDPARATDDLGGRAVVRSVLCMSAVLAARHNPVIKAVSHRLREAGKAPNVALVA